MLRTPPQPPISSKKYHSISVKSSSIDETPRNQEFEKLRHTSEVVASLPWRARYLRRGVICTFLVVFLLILITVQALLAVSHKNYGIASAGQNQHYLWVYGPTAFLTLVAAAWSRIEYQSKLVAPWCRLSQHQGDHVNSKRTVLLDYVSQYQLWTLAESIRNKDFAVSITCAVSIIVKIMIVISTGLISLSWITVRHDSYPITIQDRFVDDATRLNNTGELPYHVMEGLFGHNLTLPDGLSRDYAFQSTALESAKSGSALSSAEVRAVVEALYTSLDCEPAELVLEAAYPQSGQSYCRKTMNMTLVSGSCNVIQVSIDAPPWPAECGTKDSCNMMYARFGSARCDGMENEQEKRALVMFGNLTFTRDNDLSKNISKCWGSDDSLPPFKSEVHRSTQVLCRPHYGIRDISVVRNGTEIMQTASFDQVQRALSTVRAQDFLSAFLTTFETNPFAWSTGRYGRLIEIGGSNISVDTVMGTLLPYWYNLHSSKKAVDLYDRDVLEQAATEFYRQFGAVLGKFFLMEPASTNSFCSLSVNEDRLVVRAWAAHWMTGLTATCIALGAVLIFLLPKGGILPCNPTSLAGMATLVFHSQDLVERLKFSGAAGNKALERRLYDMSFKSAVVDGERSGPDKFVILDTQHAPHPQFRTRSFSEKAAVLPHPATLHPFSRVALFSVLGGSIIALELMLRKSNHEHGLGDAGDDDTYISYTWTALPALVFGLVAMMISSIDFHLRCVAPYENLGKTVSTKTFVEQDFLDMSVPRVIWNEIKLGNFGAFAGTTALLMASLFSIFATPLFRATAIPTAVPASLRANNSFVVNPDGFHRLTRSTSSLVLVSNLTFPRLTYENLAFPEFTAAVSSVATDGPLDLSSISINAVVPAIRPRLDCRLYNASYHQVNTTTNLTAYDGEGFDFIRIGFTGSECPLQQQEVNASEYRYSVPTGFDPEKVMYFGIAGAPKRYMGDSCADLRHTWGKIDYGADPVVRHAASLGCDVTFEVVDVNATFVGADLGLDPNNPPWVTEGSARESTMLTAAKNASRVEYAYDNVTSAVRSLFHPFFQHLTYSYRAIPLEYLGNPDRTEEVVEAIKYQYGIIQAQVLARQLVPAGQTNVTLSGVVDEDVGKMNDAQPVYTGTATDAGSGAERRRVVQHETSTRVLQGLLGAVLALLILSWVLVRRSQVLSARPTSIAAVTALIAGGNLLEVLGRRMGTQWVKDEGEWERVFGKDMRFWLGWGDVVDDEMGNCKRFGIFAWDEGVGLGQEGEREMEMMGVGLGDGIDVDTEYRGASGYINISESDADDTRHVGLHEGVVAGDHGERNGVSAW
ncbi:hypothetical protein QBC41DRAFT_286462 [Cercophora samala]|uniref:Uncharacterized protein n=1 Tax=Cercophora samala TaxID=330535 RepID=A0AA39YXK8_9PEZI|nr:hypothetical protein QBC41DRAFT_286462 [Cercophora samala]